MTEFDSDIEPILTRVAYAVGCHNMAAKWPATAFFDRTNQYNGIRHRWSIHIMFLATMIPDTTMTTFIEYKNKAKTFDFTAAIVDYFVAECAKPAYRIDLNHDFAEDIYAGWFTPSAATKSFTNWLVNLYIGCCLYKNVFPALGYDGYSSSDSAETVQITKRARR